METIGFYMLTDIKSQSIKDGTESMLTSFEEKIKEIVLHLIEWTFDLVTSYISGKKAYSKVCKWR